MVTACDSVNTSSTIDTPRSLWLEEPDAIASRATADTGKFGKIFVNQLLNKVCPNGAALRFQPSDQVFEVRWNRDPSVEDINLLEKLIEYRNAAAIVQNLGFQAKLFNDVELNPLIAKILISKTTQSQNADGQHALEVYQRIVQQYEVALKATDKIHEELNTVPFSPVEYEAIEKKISHVEHELNSISVPESLSKKQKLELEVEKKKILSIASALTESVQNFKCSVEKAISCVERQEMLSVMPNKSKEFSLEVKSFDEQLGSLPRPYQARLLEQTRALINGARSSWNDEQLKQFMLPYQPGEDDVKICDLLTQFGDETRMKFFQSLGADTKNKYILAFQAYEECGADLRGKMQGFLGELLNTLSQDQFNTLVSSRSARSSTRVVISLLSQAPSGLREAYLKKLDAYHKQDLYESLTRNQGGNGAKHLREQLLRTLSKKERKLLFPELQISDLNKRTMKQLISLPQVLKQHCVEKMDGELLCSIGFSEINPQNRVYVRTGDIDKFQPFDIEQLKKYIKSEIRNGRAPADLETRKPLAIKNIYRD